MRACESSRPILGRLYRAVVALALICVAPSVWATATGTLTKRFDGNAAQTVALGGETLMTLVVSISYSSGSANLLSITDTLPAGMVVAPAADQPAHVYFVFFDFDSARLSAAGRRAADEVVISYRQDPSSNIVVSGYTDLVGTDDYNLALSKRRAMTVYEYFAAQGVKPTDMDVNWYGKANPRVPTPKKEPQNRRVEIRM